MSTNDPSKETNETSLRSNDDVIDTKYRWTSERNPEMTASIVSQLLYFWAAPLFRRASYLRKKGDALEQDDLLPLPDIDHSANIGPVFEEAWKKQGSLNVVDATPKDTPVRLSDLQSSKKGVSTKRLWWSIMAVLGRRFVIAGIIKAFNTALQFSFPLLLNAILKFIEQSQAGLIEQNAPGTVRFRGYWLAACLFAAMAAKAITENAYFHRVFRAGYQARIAISVAVYNKALRLANAERQETTLGELVNLMQVDSTKIEMFIPQFHVLWDGMFQIIGYMVILYTLIGWPCLVGMGVMLAAGPVQGIIMRKLFGLNHKMVKFTDSRVKTTNEALQGIQCVKMYTWEESFEKEINKSRNQELKYMGMVAYLRGFSRAYMSSLPGIVAVISFVAYALAVPGANISAATLFAALVAFDQLRFPLLFYPMALAQLSQASVSLARVQAFLEMKEVGRGEAVGSGLYNRDPDKEGEIIIKNATIYWRDPSIPIASVSDDESSKSSAAKTASAVDDASTDVEEGSGHPDAVRMPKPILKSVNLRVSQGELCAIVGKVASGKSTLASAILNETILGEGEITLNGRVAYVAQSPWILNASLRDNILFGLPMDEKKYQSVLEACQLTYDLDLLADGDLTEIGERGINLSGGQKQRVSVARAAYSNADTIILDDPLSALDPEVGKKLFDECILKLMKGKTRVLVTNQLQFLRYCDNIVALGHKKVLEQGSFDELMASEGEVNRILKESSTSTAASKAEAPEDATAIEGEKSNRDSTSLKDKKANGLVTKEERNIGAVPLSVYKKYLKDGGGYLKFCVVYFSFILCAANGLASTSWVSYWTSDAGYVRHSISFYLGLYAVFAVTLGLFTYFRTLLLVRFGIRASENLHRNLLESIFRAPQSFFDTTPVGRILSRFSKDLYAIDIELSDSFDFFLWMSLQAVLSIATIIFATPWFGVAVPFLALIYIRILNYFRDVSRETKRLESISRSPVYAQFSETLGGLATIRAYGQAMRFTDEFEDKVDNNIRAYYCNKAADRWLSTRLECIGATIAGLAAVFASNVAISGSVSGTESNSNFASLAGLSLTFAISMTGILNWCVRTFAQLEASMNAVERVLHYTEEIPQEAPWTSNELERHAALYAASPPHSDPSAFAIVARGGKADSFGKNWPEKGVIKLNNLKMKYRAETPLVLKGLNVTISGGERIGVVGRTGSGKSSLLLTLLRLVEPTLTNDLTKYEAPIEIDQVDVLRIGLRELRSKLGIIPQNPVLFSGTIRSNMDPFDDYTDEQIWDALAKCGMKAEVEAMPGHLGAAVAEYGENLSAGMRQMLVLGRALLKQCRILLLDEATSSVDYETDKEIQRTIREAFPGCSVLTIAHRINTIMDSDKILVMKDGFVEEFAPPDELLLNENSSFSEIVRHSKAHQD